jgi:hypothetical protein
MFLMNKWFNCYNITIVVVGVYIEKVKPHSVMIDLQALTFIYQIANNKTSLLDLPLKVFHYFIISKYQGISSYLDIWN